MNDFAQVLLGLLGVIVGFAVLFAVLRIFSIDATLKRILVTLEAANPTSPMPAATRMAEEGQSRAGAKVVLVLAAVLLLGMVVAALVRN
jgi:hypothetical protein